MASRTVPMVLAIIFSMLLIQPAATAQNSLSPEAKSEKEFNDFTAIQSEQSVLDRISLGQAFFERYPESDLRGGVCRTLMETYRRLGRHQDVVKMGEQGLALEEAYTQRVAEAETRNKEGVKLLLEEFARTKIYYLQNLMGASQQLNDADKTVEYGEKVLGEDPDNLMALLMVPGVIAERPSEDEDELEKQMKRAEDYARKAERLVRNLLRGGAQISEEQKAGLQANVHENLGLIYLNLEKYGDAQKEYEKALEGGPRAMSYFRLGLAYGNDNFERYPEKVDRALAALAKSVYLKGVSEQPARDFLEELYEAKNKSLDGINEFIAKAGQGLN